MPTQYILILALLLVSVLAYAFVWFLQWSDRRLTELTDRMTQYEGLLARYHEIVTERNRFIDTMPQRGIYLIWCSVDNGSYLGGTEVNFHLRWGQHLTALEAGEHSNRRLQTAWNLHGIEGIHFCIVEALDSWENIKQREIEHLEWRAMNIPGKLNYNVNNSRLYAMPSLPQLQLVYPPAASARTKPAPRKPRPFKRKPRS